MACRQGGELSAPAIEEGIGADHETAGSLLDQGCECRFELALAACPQHKDLQPEGAGRRLQVSSIGLGENRIGRVDEERNDGFAGQQVMQQLKLLLRYHAGQCGDAREVAARSVQAGDKSNLDRVGAGHEDDRNRRGRRLCRDCCRGAACGYHRNLTANQIGRQGGQSIVSALRPAIFDPHVWPST